MLDLLLLNSHYIQWTKKTTDQIVSSYISRMVLLTDQLLSGHVVAAIAVSILW